MQAAITQPPAVGKNPFDSAETADLPDGPKNPFVVSEDRQLFH